MVDRPIIMSAPMVRALLAWRKVQTRRILKPQPEKQLNGNWHVSGCGGGLCNVKQQDIGDAARDYVPWHEDQRLWVREAWRAQEAFDALSPKTIGCEFEAEHGDAWCPVFFEADRRCDGSSIEMWQQSLPGRLRASIHMPRWASRLTLLVSDVRVERLQDISREDVIAEGIAERDGLPIKDCWAGWHEPYADLWDSLHGKGAWDENPWVAVISFVAVAKNIDQVAALRSAPSAPEPHEERSEER